MPPFGGVGVAPKAKGRGERPPGSLQNRLLTSCIVRSPKKLTIWSSFGVE